ncbi:metal-dependent hydrolase [Desulfobacterales bacterium HSG2]|nr:metal-dependent hydrolase [Desulfobacterales bacterium HSG2]
MNAVRRNLYEVITKKMSSFIGHSVTGVAIFLYLDRKISERNIMWLAWLIFLAIFPDTEYVLLWLAGKESEIRFTHSLIFCSLLPIATILYCRLRLCEREYKTVGIQVFVAGYSHLLLDMLVGVSPLPLLWPLNDTLFKLPFGILPSAGRIDLMNIYFYRNLFIESGILLPVYSLILMKNSVRYSEKRLLTLLHGCILMPFLIWGISLQR